MFFQVVSFPNVSPPKFLDETLPYLPRLIAFDLNIRIILDERLKSWRYSLCYLLQSPATSFLYSPIALSTPLGTPSSYEICLLLGYYAVCSGTTLPNFVKTYLSLLKIGQIGSHETSFSNYHCTLHNIPEQLISRLQRDGSLRSPSAYISHSI